MINFDEAFSWLNKFDDVGSYLSSFDQRLVTQVESAYKDQDFGKVRLYLDLLLNTTTKIEIGSIENAEIFTTHAKYEYLLGDYEGAADLLKRGFQQYYPSMQHNMGVVQWLLGCAFWRIPEQKKRAMTAWKMCIDIFQALSNTYDVEKAEWYNQVTGELENSLVEAIESMKKPAPPIQVKPTGDYSNGFGLLRIPITSVLPAQALSEIISLVDDVYCGQLWLSLAESASENQPFPDTYELREEETLYISQLQIGTPNFLEFFGQAESLLTVLGIVGGAIGLVKATINIVKSGNELKNLKLDNRLKQLSIIEKELDIQQKQEGGRLSPDSEPSSHLVQTDQINIRELKHDLGIQAHNLAAEGKISHEASNHKIKLQEDIDARERILPIYIISDLTLTFFGDEIVRPSGMDRE